MNMHKHLFPTRPWQASSRIDIIVVLPLKMADNNIFALVSIC